MTTVPIAEFTEVTLDSTGGGTARLGPEGSGEIWTPSSVHVIASSNVSEATCAIYAGPSADRRYFKDLTVDGSTGDATERANIPIGKGSWVWAVWSGGDPGATATLSVDGSKEIL